MKKTILWSAIVMCVCTRSAFAQNKVVFDNQSGEPALVKLIGPSSKDVEVANSAKAGVDATAGRYIIKVRYGTPGKYRYSKGEEFDVAETATAKSETTITLHKVVAGNYDSQPISEKEFAALATGSQEGSAANDSATAASGPRWATVVLDIMDDANAARLQNIATLQMTMFGTASTEVLGQNVSVLEKKWSIAAIQKKHGKPDKVEMATRDEKGTKVDVQRYTYGPFIIETMKDNDAVSWLYAPCGDWADGIRKAANSAIQKAKPAKAQ